MSKSAEFHLFIESLLDNGFTPGDLLLDAADIAPYCKDWRGLQQTSAQAVLMPRSTAMVQKALLCANAHQIAITVQGGRTGLVLGSIPSPDIPDGVVLSLSRLNSVIKLDTVNATITVEAGCLLQTIIDYVDDAGLYFPLSLGAKGSCQIGGNLSTNAGGINVLKYGNARAQCLGLEAVLADGRMISNLSGLRKDNRGYDLGQLLIGSEGTLGIITKAVLKLFPKPKAHVTFAIGLETPQQALALLGDLKACIGDQVTSFELISKPPLDAVEAFSETAKIPMPTPTYLVLGEVSLFSAVEPQRDAVFEVLAQANETSGLGGESAVIAMNDRERDALWHLREEVVLCQIPAGPSIKHDISVPVSRLPEMIERGVGVAKSIVPECTPSPFGHAGDGNLHFNITAPKGWSQEEFFKFYKPMNRAIHDLVHELGGSFSAEHGIGRQKADELPSRLSADALDVMKSIKTALDPKGILNPGKLFVDRF